MVQVVTNTVQFTYKTMRVLFTEIMINFSGDIFVTKIVGLFIVVFNSFKFIHKCTKRAANHSLKNENIPSKLTSQSDQHIMRKF